MERILYLPKFLVTISLVPEDLGCIFLTTKCLRQNVEKKVLTAKLEFAFQFAWVAYRLVGQESRGLGHINFQDRMHGPTELVLHLVSEAFYK